MTAQANVKTGRPPAERDTPELVPCVCRRKPDIERYALYPDHGYLSCDCGITFNGHHGDSVAKVIERWNRLLRRAQTPGGGGK